MDVSINIIADKNPTQILAASIAILMRHGKNELAKYLTAEMINLADSFQPPIAIDARLMLSKIMENQDMIHDAQQYVYEAGRIAEFYGQHYWIEKVKNRYLELSTIVTPLKKFENYYKTELEKSRLLLRNGQVEKALQGWRLMLNIVQESEQPPLMIKIVLEMSRILAEENYHQEAIIYGQLAEDMAQRSTNPFWCRQVRKYLETIKALDIPEINQDMGYPTISNPSEILSSLLSADDLYKAIQDNLASLNLDLVNYIKVKANHAFEEGNNELAQTLSDLASVIEELIISI